MRHYYLMVPRWSYVYFKPYCLILCKVWRSLHDIWYWLQMLPEEVPCAWVCAYGGREMRQEGRNEEGCKLLLTVEAEWEAQRTRGIVFSTFVCLEFTTKKVTPRMRWKWILNHIKIKSHLWSKLERHRISNWENTYQKSLLHILCADLVSVFEMEPLQALSS